MARSIQGSMRLVLAQYRNRCRRRGVEWRLTEQEFVKLTQANCAYCGRGPSNKNNAYVYNGIDRRDNSLGYVPGNCATACKECNSIKGEHLSYSEMMAAALAIREHRKHGEKV